MQERHDNSVEGYYKLRLQFETHYNCCLEFIGAQSGNAIGAPMLNLNMVTLLSGDLRDGMPVVFAELEKVSHFSHKRMEFLKQSTTALSKYLHILNAYNGIHLPLDKIPKNDLQQYLGKSYKTRESIFEDLYRKVASASSTLGLNISNLQDHTSHLVSLVLGLSKTESLLDLEHVVDIIEQKIVAINTERAMHRELDVFINKLERHFMALLDMRFTEFKLGFQNIINDMEQYLYELAQILDSVKCYEKTADRLDYLNSQWNRHTHVSVDLMTQRVKEPFGISGIALLKKLALYGEAISQKNASFDSFAVLSTLQNSYNSIKQRAGILTRSLAIERTLLLADAALDKSLDCIPNSFSDNYERYKAMKNLERFIKDHLPRLPPGAEEHNQVLYRVLHEKIDTLKLHYASLKKEYLQHKRDELVAECIVLDETNNFSGYPGVLSEIKAFKYQDDSRQINVQQLHFFENKFTCKAALITKEQHALVELLTDFFDNRKEVGGRFGSYLKHRSEHYRVADFFRDVLAFPLTLFGYQSDRRAREYYIQELRLTMNACIQPNANLKIALLKLSEKIEYGRMHFKPRALEGVGYDMSLHKFLSDFKEKIDPMINEHVTLYESPFEVAQNLAF